MKIAYHIKLLDCDYWPMKSENLKLSFLIEYSSSTTHFVDHFYRIWIEIDLSNINCFTVEF